jgi:glutaredoxin 3
MKKIKIYSIPECKYCNELKELLTKDGIEYEDVNIMLQENAKEYEKIYAATKSEQVPIVLIGKQLLVPEVSFKSISEAAILTKNFLV